MRSAVIGITVLASLALACEEPVSEMEEARTTSDIPVSRVVLYRSGIAYIEHGGPLEEPVMHLQIRPDQINDILTTLTVIVDRGDGAASTISLPIERTIAQELDQLPPQVRQQGGMQALLDAFRGAHVELTSGRGTTEGRIVGTEALPNDEGNLIRRVTLMTDEGELVQHRIDDIIEVRMDNRALAIGMEKSLDVSLGEGDWKPVEVEINLAGEPPHEVALSYVVSMPTWKPTYRIVIDGDRIQLQGWAVVDNVSGEDWRDIELSLVAGTPISFAYDLHSPHFVSRPDLTSRGFVDETAMLPPPEAQPAALSGLAQPYPEMEMEEDRQEGRYRRRGSAPGGGGYAAMADQEEPEPMISGEAMIAGMGESAASEQLDNLFRYDVTYPVTIRDRESALVAILNEPVDGEDVLYFDAANHPPTARNRPFRAVRLDNQSGYTIERGPLAIFKNATFVGQAIAPRIGEDEMVFLPYSLDGRFVISQRRDTNEQAVHLVRIFDGVIETQMLQIQSRTFEVTNHAGEAVRLYVNVPKRTNWELRQPDPADVLDEGQVYYVPMDLDGSASQEFTIEETTTVTRTVQVWSELAPNLIGLYLSNPDAVPETRELLQGVLEKQQRIAAIELELEPLLERQRQYETRMRELRGHIEALGDSREVRDERREFERLLGETDGQHAEVTLEIINLREEQTDLRRQVNEAVRDVTLWPEEEAQEEAN